MSDVGASPQHDDLLDTLSTGDQGFGLGFGSIIASVIVNDLHDHSTCAMHIHAIALNGPWEAFRLVGLDIGRTEHNGKWDREARRNGGRLDAPSK
jgi:hypothetical protein